MIKWDIFLFIAIHVRFFCIKLNWWKIKKWWVLLHWHSHRSCLDGATLVLWHPNDHFFHDVRFQLVPFQWILFLRVELSSHPPLQAKYETTLLVQAEPPCRIKTLICLMPCVHKPEVSSGLVTELWFIRIFCTSINIRFNLFNFSLFHVIFYFVRTSLRNLKWTQNSVNS